MEEGPVEGAACAWEGGARACGQGGAAGVARRRAAPQAFEGRRAAGSGEGADAPGWLPQRAGAPNRAQRRCGGGSTASPQPGCAGMALPLHPRNAFWPPHPGLAGGPAERPPRGGPGPGHNAKAAHICSTAERAPQLTSVCVATPAGVSVGGRLKPCTPRASWRRPRVSHATRWAVGCRGPGSPAIPHHHTFLCPSKHRWGCWGSP